MACELLSFSQDKQDAVLKSAKAHTIVFRVTEYHIMRRACPACCKGKFDDLARRFGNEHVPPGAVRVPKIWGRFFVFEFAENTVGEPADLVKKGMHVTNGVAELIRNGVSGVVLREDLLEINTRHRLVDQDPTNFFGAEEKGLLKGRINRNGAAPEMTDSSSSDDVSQWQLRDDVAEQLGSEEHRVCGGLARFSGDGHCVRRLQRARCAALCAFSLSVEGIHGVCGVKGVWRAVRKVSVVWPC